MSTAEDATMAVAEVIDPPTQQSAAHSGAEAAADAPAMPPLSPPRRSFRARVKLIALAPFVLLRFLLRKLLYVIVRLLTGAWRRPIVTLLLIVLAGLGYQGYNEYIKDEPPPPPAEVFDIAEAIPPAPVAKDFLAAQQEFDGERIWNELLTEEAKNEMLGQGISLQTFNQQLQSVRDSGIFFGGSIYIGGKTGTDVSYYFYVTTLRSVTGQELEIYQVLWIDPQSGKLMRFDSPIQN